MFEHEGNIILNKITSDSIKEVIPYMPADKNLLLILNKNKEIAWSPYYQYNFSNELSVNNINGVVTVDASVDTRVIIDGKIKDTNIHYNNERIGIGRSPMYSYLFDIGIPKNSTATAFHIGDGAYGFSMGNGTNQGFIPEIIGMGSDENDAGLYMIGRAGNDKPSSIPLIIIDGRNHLHQEIKNRPIFGITNSRYNEYKLLVDQVGRVGIGKIPEIYKLEVEGSIKASNFILDSSISFRDLVEIIVDQKQEIDILNDRVAKLEKE